MLRALERNSLWGAGTGGAECSKRVGQSTRELEGDLLEVAWCKEKNGG